MRRTRGSKPTRVDGKEQSALHLCQLLVQVLPTDARLHDDVHIVLVELDDLIHVREIDADSTKRRREVPLQTGTPRIRDDGNSISVAYARDGRYLLRGFWVRNGDRETLGVRGRPLRVSMSM